MTRFRAQILFEETIKGQIERCAASYGLDDFPEKASMLWGLTQPYVMQDAVFVKQKAELDPESEGYWFDLFKLLIMSLDRMKLLLKTEETFGDDQLG